MPETLTSKNPATGETLDDVPITLPEAVPARMEAARSAQEGWSARPIKERLDVLDAFQRAILDDRHELAQMIAEEAGKPYREALVTDVLPTVDMVRVLKDQGAQALQGRFQRLDNPLLKDRKSRIDRVPLGVIAIIAPWNYPLAIPATQTATALFAGNTVALKPSEHTPLVGAALVERFHQAGVPEDALVLVQGAGDTGNALVEAGPEKVLFTGSVEVGRTVAETAAQNGAGCTLEMGGNDPMIVLDDANLELAARGAVWGAFSNAGQTCAAVERVYVEASVHDAFLENVVDLTETLTLGPGVDPETEVGPLIMDAGVERVEAHVQDAVSQGANIETGGTRGSDLGDRFYEPTVLSDVDASMLVMQEETFGPLLPIQSVPDASTALEEANASRYGLTGSVWTTRPDRGDALAARLNVGTVTVNDHAYTYGACETPWGGVKDSGSGVTHGRWGLEDVTRIKHVNKARANRATSPWYFPYDEDLERMGDEGLELIYGRKRVGIKALPASTRRLFGARID